MLPTIGRLRESELGQDFGRGRIRVTNRGRWFADDGKFPCLQQKDKRGTAIVAAIVAAMVTVTVAGTATRSCIVTSVYSATMYIIVCTLHGQTRT
jgi:hypothetical protein